ncbi:MAG: peptidoglycan DD-metalloendopeptidase family protein [Prevotellaceae bacterium]|nr:peptidoglycan DD-metalloendopeptidase family protein [Candidatus Minthosoma equi]
MDCSTIKKTLGIALLSMISVSSFAQDIIARQAPSDRRLKDVHNVKLANTVTSIANLENPAADIYTDWTDAVSRCGGNCPANYKIDLRGFHMPTPSRKVTSPFGPRWGRQHSGLDIKVYIGDTIRSAFDGKVRICKYDGNGYGYFLVIRHPNGLETLYGHMSKQLVKAGQIVRAGEPIGLGGNTGRSTGSHLHFETRMLGQAINPAFMFDFENQDVTGDYYVLGTGAISKSATASAARSANRVEAENKAAAKQTAQKSVTHSVQAGETLSSIARQYGTTVDKLCKLNGIKSNTVIRKGQVIKCS